MKAIAVIPGEKNGVHLAELPKPSVNDVPNGRDRPSAQADADETGLGASP